MKVTLDVPVTRVSVHPKNPRRNAVADEELVASVAESGITSPLLVAVNLAKHTAADVLAHANGDRTLMGGVHVVALDGHRRRDAAKKAKLKTVPVVIDLALDSDVDQLKAMILANEHREDLTPVEVAESYQALLNLGLKQADVAKAMGRKPREISTQLKVLKLATTTQTKVHEGVLTLDDAAGLLEFAGDPDITKRLELAAESGVDFRYQLQRARQRRDLDQKTAAEIAELEQAGVTQVEYAVWQKAPWTEMRRVGMVPGVNSDPPVHDECHAYVVTPATEHQAAQVIEICTDVARHDTAAGAVGADAEAARAAEAEQWRAEQQSRAEARAAAQAVRHGVVRDIAAQDLKISPALEQLLRALLPSLWALLDYDDRAETYEKLADVHEAARVARAPYGPARDTALVEHLADFANLPKAALGKHLVAMLAAAADDEFSRGLSVESDDPVQRAVVAPYVDLLEAAGYEFAGPDAELKAHLDHPTADEAGPDDVEGASS